MVLETEKFNSMVLARALCYFNSWQRVEGQVGTCVNEGTKGMVYTTLLGTTLIPSGRPRTRTPPKCPPISQSVTWQLNFNVISVRDKPYRNHDTHYIYLVDMGFLRLGSQKAIPWPVIWAPVIEEAQYLIITLQGKPLREVGKQD